MTHISYKKRKRASPEGDLQKLCVKFLDVALPANSVYFAVPNGGSRNVIEAVNLKRQGVVAGIPDLIILWERRAYCIELKSPTGRLSDAQRTMHPRIQSAGVPVEVVRSEKELQLRLTEFGIPLRASVAA